jgi:hypothetical protein
LLALAAGCGAAPEPADSLAAARAALERQDTVRFEASSAKTPMRCEGAIDVARDRLWLRCFLGDYDLELISIGPDSYERDSLDGPLATARWSKRPADSTLNADRMDPRAFLDDYRRATVATEEIESRRVRGVETRGYRLTLDPERLPSSEDAPSPHQVDVWLDEDDLLRRVGGDFATEFFGYGEPVTIEPPPATDVEEEADVADEPECPDVDAETSPLREQQVVEVLGRHGFVPGIEVPGCRTDEPGWPGADAGWPEPHQGAEVTCTLQRSMPAGGTRRVRAVERAGAAHALAVANLECALTVAAGTPVEPLRKDFAAAFDELGEE